MGDTNSAQRHALRAIMTAAQTHASTLLLVVAGVFVLGQAYCAGIRHQASKDADRRGRELASIARVEAQHHRRDSIDRAVQIALTRAAERRADSALAELKHRVVVVLDTGSGRHRDVVVSVDGAPPSRMIPANIAIPALQLCAASDSAGRKLVIADSAVITDRNKQLITANEQTANERARATLAKGFTIGALTGSLLTLLVVIAVH